MLISFDVLTKVTQQHVVGHVCTVHVWVQSRAYSASASIPVPLSPLSRHHGSKKLDRVPINSDETHSFNQSAHHVCRVHMLTEPRHIIDGPHIL